MNEVVFDNVDQKVAILLQEFQFSLQLKCSPLMNSTIDPIEFGFSENMN
jgi:hypothetical protein